MTVTEVSHDAQIANMKPGMQYNNGAETNSKYTIRQNTMDAQQIDIAVNDKANGEISDSPNLGRQHNRHIANKHGETNIQM